MWLQAYTNEGLRVIALAAREITCGHPSEVRKESKGATNVKHPIACKSGWKACIARTCRAPKQSGHCEHEADRESTVAGVVMPRASADGMCCSVNG